MIGGMVSSTLLTLVVIPAIYALIKGIGLPAGQDDGGSGHGEAGVGGSGSPQVVVR
jgi:Cu(I)/Ag(I) efflux system membrane protein CusA/SilA